MYFHASYPDFFFSIFSDSRATFTSSFAGSESVFASKETGVSSIPSEMASIDEDKILCVSTQISTHISIQLPFSFTFIFLLHYDKKLRLRL